MIRDGSNAYPSKRRIYHFDIKYYGVMAGNLKVHGRERAIAGIF